MEIYAILWVYPGVAMVSPRWYKVGRKVNYYAIRFYSMLGTDYPEISKEQE